MRSSMVVSVATEILSYGFHLLGRTHLAMLLYSTTGQMSSGFLLNLIRDLQIHKLQMATCKYVAIHYNFEMFL